MEPGPLPPHERTWRHPSELGPTKLDVDTGSSNHLVGFIGGLFAVAAVAVAVVAMSPRPTGGTVAISATTTPMTQLATISTPTLRTPTPATAVRPTGVRSAPTLLTTFTAVPHAVSTGPQLELDGVDVATDEPDADETVYVRTDDVTYRVRWGHVAELGAPDGTVVFDAAGDLIARVNGGVLLSLVDE
ncbi:MAG: hypothetical protein WBP59_09560 [Ilumatobacteraceae bacterium]